jgi:hypothetical protein
VVAKMTDSSLVSLIAIRHVYQYVIIYIIPDLELELEDPLILDLGNAFPI